MQISKPFLFMSLFLSATMAQAFPCIFTLVKDRCWKDYTVNVEVKDLRKEISMLAIEVPKGQSWSRKEINCYPDQKIVYSATFNPAIWQGQENEVYFVQKTWSLPKAIKANETAWEVRICFPQDFSKVPVPPTAGSNCSCDFTAPPTIAPR